MAAAAPWQRHLAAMGVDLYLPRARPAPSQMLQEPPDPVAWVGVDGEPRLSLASDDPVGTLLLKVLAATGFDADRFAVCRLGEPLPEPPADLLRIWFSQRSLDAGDGCVVLPELGAMLGDPAQKKLAWTRLKPFIARLQAGRDAR